jgi:hypothetical protein
MPESADWLAERARHERFLATELGRTYAAFHKATIDYWRRDADETFPYVRLQELDRVYREKQKEFVRKLMDVAGL